MTRRRTNKKKKLTKQAVATGDEPPEPITILTILAVTGTVVGAAGTAFGAVAANRQAQSQAAMANANAAAAKRDADYARNQAQYNEMLAKQRADRVRGAQRAGIAASGVDFTGSPLDLLEETTIQSEMDRQEILRSGEYKASGYDFQAAGQRYQANAYRSAGSTALTTGMLSAGGQLVGGVASAGYGYKKMKAGEY
jgi:hypothetical protein